MKHIRNILRTVAIAGFMLLLSGIGVAVHAQQRITVQAVARGTNTQMGKLVNVNIIIEQISPPEDQQALINALARSGNEGVLDTLNQMRPKGRLAVIGTVGNDIKYIREFPSDKGRKFRLITDREIGILEQRNSPRVEEYSLSAVELTISPDGKGSGTLLPACKLRVNKNKEIEIETFQNPWELTNLIVSGGK